MGKAVRLLLVSSLERVFFHFAGVLQLQQIEYQYLGSIIRYLFVLIHGILVNIMLCMDGVREKASDPFGIGKALSRLS